MGEITYESLGMRSISPRLIRDLNHLVRPHGKTPSVTAPQIRGMLRAGVRVFGAYEDESLVGVVTLCSIQTLEGQMDEIKDFFVDPARDREENHIIMDQLLIMAVSASIEGLAKSLKIEDYPWDRRHRFYNQLGFLGVRKLVFNLHYDRLPDTLPAKSEN